MALAELEADLRKLEELKMRTHSARAFNSVPSLCSVIEEFLDLHIARLSYKVTIERVGRG